MIYLVNCDECIQHINEHGDGQSRFEHSPHSFAAQMPLNELLERIFFTQQKHNQDFPNVRVSYQLLSVSTLPDDTNLGRVADLQVEIWLKDIPVTSADPLNEYIGLSCMHRWPRDKGYRCPKCGDVAAERPSMEDHKCPNLNPHP